MEVSQTVRRPHAVAHNAQQLQEYEQARQIVLTNPQNAGSSFLKKSIFFMPLLGISLLFWTVFSPSQPSISSTDYGARTEDLLKTTPLIDGHNDLPFLLRMQLDNEIYGDRLPFEEKLGSHTDLRRMKEGKLGGQFWSVYIECPDIVHLDDPTHNVRDTLEQIDVAKRFINEYFELHYCDTASCAMKAFGSGSIASMLGVEGLHQAGSSIAVIRQFYDLGVRYITLTHNCDNPFATAASTVTMTGKDGGLTDFGKAGVREMNRLGMMIDLSHVSHRTMRNVLEISQSPVMFSHTGCYGLAKSFRNAPDDVIVQLKTNGGIIMIYFASKFLDLEHPQNANVETVVDHIFYAAGLAGWDHVGIGGDFDGTMNIANGINDVSGYPLLMVALMRRGATDEDVRKIAGENILRVWRQNEIVALRLQKIEGIKPAEDRWEGRVQVPYQGQLPTLIPGY
ncbi:putative dipeptidase [Lachnellula subtilissima]|uniref:Dipeptidase n=1 Tax=Lachnellula subtilissima TaxID=602034 RepID=A0A8H8RIP1_9HELO|nr:putative dipeptidase [Lachnellula subtilissima]